MRRGCVFPVHRIIRALVVNAVGVLLGSDIDFNTLNVSEIVRL